MCWQTHPDPPRLGLWVSVLPPPPLSIVIPRVLQQFQYFYSLLQDGQTVCDSHILYMWQIPVRYL